MDCVFDNPIHENGGCIFADPNEFLVIEDGIAIGGGTKRSRRHVPGVTSNRSIAFREDEELLAMLEAYFNTKRH